jgi:hypothetical protein
MVTLFIYGNANNKHSLLRKVQVQQTAKNTYPNGKFNLEYFRKLACDIEPNMTSVWVQ